MAAQCQESEPSPWPTRATAAGWVTSGPSSPGTPAGSGTCRRSEQPRLPLAASEPIHFCSVPGMAFHQAGGGPAIPSTQQVKGSWVVGGVEARSCVLPHLPKCRGHQSSRHKSCLKPSLLTSLSNGGDGDSGSWKAQLNSHTFVEVYELCLPGFPKAARTSGAGTRGAWESLTQPLETRSAEKCLFR